MKTFVVLLLSLISLSFGQFYTEISTTSQNCDIATTTTASVFATDRCITDNINGGTIMVTCNTTHSSFSRFADATCSGAAVTNVELLDTCNQQAEQISCGALLTGLPDGTFVNIFDGSCDADFVQGVYFVGDCDAQGCTTQQGVTGSVTCGNQFLLLLPRLSLLFL